MKMPFNFLSGNANQFQYAPQQQSPIAPERMQVMMAGQLGVPVGSPQASMQFNPQTMQPNNQWQQFSAPDMSAMNIPSNAGANGFGPIDRLNRGVSNTLGNYPQANAALSTSGNPSAAGGGSMAGFGLNILGTLLRSRR